MEKLKILAFTAHADDLEVHASGLVMQLVDAGHEVTSYVTTYGLRRQVIGRRRARDVRIEESTKAHALLNLEPSFDLAIYEQELNVDKETRAAFKDHILTREPDVVITHWPIDVNPDHRATALLAMEPCYQLGINTEILYFESISSGRWSTESRPQTMCFIPTHYCPLTPKLVEKKRTLTMCHISQDPENMFNGQLQLEENRGREAHCESAEAWIAGKRCGDMLEELRPFLQKSRWNLPRSIGANFSPETIGIMH